MPRQVVNEKPKKFKKTLKEMVGYLKPYFPLILIAVVASVIATILQIIGPDKLKLITSLSFYYIKFGDKKDWDIVFPISIFILSLFSFKLRVI